MLPWFVWAFGAALLFTVEVLLEKKLLFKQHVVQFLTVFSAVLLALVLPFASKVNVNLSGITYGIIFVTQSYGLLV